MLKVSFKCQMYESLPKRIFLRLARANKNTLDVIHKKIQNSLIGHLRLVLDPEDQTLKNLCFSKMFNSCT